MKKPFFARFLEHQLRESDTLRLQGGEVGGSVTDKAPSDSDEIHPVTNGAILDVIEITYATQKVPSDQEEGIIPHL